MIDQKYEQLKATNQKLQQDIADLTRRLNKTQENYEQQLAINAQLRHKLQHLSSQQTVMGWLGWFLNRTMLFTYGMIVAAALFFGTVWGMTLAYNVDLPTLEQRLTLNAPPPADVQIINNANTLSSCNNPDDGSLIAECIGEFEVTLSTFQQRQPIYTLLLRGRNDYQEQKSTLNVVPINQPSEQINYPYTLRQLRDIAQTWEQAVKEAETRVEFP